MPQFDVFLSHSSVDKPWVTRLKDDLLRYGVSVWLDQDEIRPGDLFAEALEQALDNCRAVALIVSPEAVASGWVKEEYYRALSLAKSKEARLQLIPVILRDAELPGFLQSRNWVDFRDEANYAQSVWRLVWGITGQKPGQLLDLKTPDTPASTPGQPPRQAQTSPSPTPIRYSLRKIRALVTDSFTAAELRQLCFDVPEFRPVYNTLYDEMSQADIVDRLLEHTDRKLQLEILLAAVKEHNPARYQLYQPYYDS